MLKKLTGYLFISSFIIVSPGCNTGSSPDTDSTTIKNVIIMIGDGMGPQQVGLLNSYAKYAPNSIYKAKGRTT
ncbi:MAG: alkaline phosphatase, partial [Candidatus Parabeggiatoa sp. nov. 2]